LNGPDFLLSGVADGTGHCGQVAEASDNPGYNEDANRAAPLKKVIASKGDCAG
jgi:hypothetical protein